MADIAELGFKVTSDPIKHATDRLDELAPAADRAERATDRFNNTNGTGRKSVDALASGVGNLTTIVARLAAGFAAAISVTQLISLTNTWTDLNSRVEIASGSMGRGAEVMSRLSEMARRTYSSLELTAESYLRNAVAMRQLGYSTNETLDYVEAINNALVVSGAKGERAESVLNALGKAMALGKLSGDQLETVLASGGRVAEALADSLGVTVLELRKLGAEGKLTGDVLMNGLTSQLETLRAEADAMPATIGDAFVLLGNSILMTVGQFDQMTGASSQVAAAIIMVADNMDVVSAVLAGTAAVVMTALVPSFVAATAAAWTFTAALLANPLTWVAIAIGVVVAGVVLLIQRMGGLGNAFQMVQIVALDVWNRISNAGIAFEATMQQVSDNFSAYFTQAWVNVLRTVINGISALNNSLNTNIDLTGLINATADAMGRVSDQSASAAANGEKAAAAWAKATGASAKIDIVQQGASWDEFNSVLGATAETAGMVAPAVSAIGAAASGATPKVAEMSDAMKTAMKEAEQTLDFYKQTFSSFFSDFKSNLQNGQNLWQAFGNAAASALDRIADRALSMAADGIFDMIFGAVTNGLMSGGLGGTSSITGSSGGFFPGFATGGFTGNAGMGQAAGIVHGQEFVMNAQATRSIGLGTLNAMNDNGQVPANSNGGEMTYNDHRVYEIHGERSVAEQIAGAIKSFDKQMPERVQQIQRNPRDR